MRFTLAATVLVFALATSRALAEDAEKSAANRRTVFETWGDEWFVQDGKDDMPPFYHHLQSKRCTSCDDKDWVVTFERYLPLSMNVAVDRTTMHVTDDRSLAVLKSVDATFDDPWRDAFRLTFSEKSIRSEVEVCLEASESLRHDFAEQHTWEQACETRVWNARCLYKTLEIMALDGTDKLSMPVLGGRKVKTVTLVFVEAVEVEHDGKKVKSRCYEARAEGETDAPRFWVSPDLGLLRFSGRGGAVIHRVSAEIANRELALLAKKAEKERLKVFGDDPKPNPTTSPKEIRVVMECKEDGAGTTMTVNGRAAADVAALEAILVENVEARVKARQEYVVLIDASSKVPWKRVIEVMDLCKKHDITKVELAAPVPQKK